MLDLGIAVGTVGGTTRKLLLSSLGDGKLYESGLCGAWL
jgi:hypothetical protein